METKKRHEKPCECGCVECHSCGGKFSPNVVVMTDWGYACEACNDDINRQPLGS